MRAKTPSQSTVTTIRLNADDWKAVEAIKEQYGATSTAGAIRLALRQVAKSTQKGNTARVRDN